MNVWPWSRIRVLEDALEAARELLRDEYRKTDTLTKLLHKAERNDMTDRAHRCKQCGYVYLTWNGPGRRPRMTCPVCGQHIAYDYGYEGTD